MSKRNYLVNIYNDTKLKCKSGKYGKFELCNSEKFSYSDERTSNLTYDKKYETVIKVVNQDVLAVTDILYNLRDEKNIMVLNLASYFKSGGGVRNGAMAQEEELFRRTNYHMVTDETLYPIQKGDVIYTKNVYVVKDDKYEDIEKPFKVAMLAACAVKNPHLTNDYKYNKNDYITMNNVIHNIFKTAYYNKHETLVLGALGCGAYYNPPEEVVKIFNKYLEKFNGCFRTIIFAVYSKDNVNYDVFFNNIIRKFK